VMHGMKLATFHAGDPKAWRHGTAGRDFSAGVRGAGLDMWTMCWPSRSYPPSMGPLALRSPLITRWGQIISSWPAMKRRSGSMCRCLQAAMAGRVGAHRARFGVRRKRCQDDRGEEGRPLCAQRKQDLHHNGSHADVAVVIAVTDKSKGTHGLSAFLVEKGTPGFRPGKKRTNSD